MSATGGAVAAAMITSSQIQDNTIRSADVKNGTLKTRDISAAARAALQGNTGPAGPFAVISTTGVAFQGRGVVSVSHPATGTYDVTFNQNVSQCAQLATPLDGFDFVRTTEGQRYPGGATTDVRVELGDSTGAPANAGFTLGILC